MKLADKVAHYIDLITEIRLDIAKELRAPGGSFVNDIKLGMDIKPDILSWLLTTSSTGLVNDIETLATAQYYKAIFVDMGKEETWKPVADKSTVDAMKMLRLAIEGFTVKEAKIIIDLYRAGKI